MFAVVNRLPIGVAVWVLIGLSIGYIVALLAERPGISWMPILAGLVGGLVPGLFLGLALSGYRLWICHLASAAGALLLAMASLPIGRPKHV